MSDREIPSQLIYTENLVDDARATIVCVHGGLDRGASFSRVARRLDDFSVVTYDRRGYAASRPLGPLSLARHVDDLLSLASRARRRGPVMVLGHSYGGIVAITAALEAPELVNVLVCFETPLPWVLSREGGDTPLSPDGGYEVERFFTRMVSAATWERMSEPARDDRRADGPALLDDLGTLRDAAPFDLSTMAVPLVYAYGDSHRPEYYRQLVIHLDALSPKIHHRAVENTGHGIHLSAPERLGSLLRDAWREYGAS